MKNSAIKLWPLLCAILLLLNACQKETSTSKGEAVNNENQGIRTGGALPDDPALVAKVPMIVSSEFSKSINSLGARGGVNSGKDSDKDGIPDSKDACPTQKETVNGYQDTDGCPDTVPSPTLTDTDGDGIADTNDACPTQKETVNGYQDTDGCPDTVPDTDADGIIDTQDGCPTEKETVNGYEDTDGCPDTPPLVLPPATLPSSVQLLMPPVGNQGSESSCIGWATAYARSCEYFYYSNAASYSNATNIFSPEYIYNLSKVNSDCSSGTAFIITLNLMVDKGACTWQSMPYSSSNGCSSLPSPTQDNEAANFKIANFSRILNNDQAAIKNMIVNKHPVLTGISIDNNFRNASPGYIWNNYSGFSGDHGVVICGYDDAKHAYLAINSWGTSWGDAGYIWIDYDFFPTISSYYLYVMK